MATRDPHIAAAQIVRYAGGEIVGRTRLQKVAYLMQLAGFSDDFFFEYRLYGPYSEDLARGIAIATAFGDIQEEQRLADWGGRYSIYRVSEEISELDGARISFAKEAISINAIELELAATAAFLYENESVALPWQETRRRKPEKASHGRLECAKAAYERLRTVGTPRELPALPD